MGDKLLGRRINAARKDRGITSERLSELCNINDYFPNLALIKGAKNQFICDDCAEAVQKEGEQI